MRSATSVLRNEHTAILAMLEAAEEAARRAEEGTIPNAQTLAGLLEFFKIFVDHCHHAKEEQLLFPALERKGMSRSGGPIGVMLYEHEKGRVLIRQMSDSWKAATNGDANAAHTWVAAVRSYAALLQSHIAKENDILFVMADRVLSEAEQSDLVRAFDKLETEQIGEGTHERLHASIHKLSSELLRK